MTKIQAIRELVASQRMRLLALVIRGSAQVLVALPPLVVLAKYGAGGAGLFAILIAVGGLSVVMEWGLSYRLQNEISRGENPIPCTWHWLLVKSGFIPHLLLNVFLGFLFCHFASAMLPRMFPGEVGKVLAGNPNALALLVLVTAVSAAGYHGRSIIFGLGHVDRGFLMALVGALASLCMVGVGCMFGASVTAIAVCALSASLVERVLGAFYCFSGFWTLQRHPMMPAPTSASSQANAGRGRKVAFMFFYLQVLSMVANNIDALYASRCRSLSAVGEFAFLLKLFGVPLLIINVLNTAAWPRIAVESRDRPKGACQTIQSLLKSNLAVTLAGGLLVVFSAEFIYRRISGVPGNLLILSLLMLCDGCFQAVRGVMTTFVNAAEIIWINIAGNTVFSFAAIFVKILMVDHFGIRGLILANLLSYLVFLLPFHLLALFRPAGRSPS